MFVDKVASNVLYVIYTNCNIRSFWKMSDQILSCADMSEHFYSYSYFML